MVTYTPPSSLPHIQIRSDHGQASLEVLELFRQRSLLFTLADRDLKVRYKQTVLGVLWVVLQPLMAALIFAFIFGKLAGLPSDGRPYILFAYAGLLAWNTFAQVLTRVSYSLVGNAHLI